MITYLLSSILCLFSPDPASSKSLQTDNFVKVSGTCYDVNTGVDLKIKAYTFNGNDRLLLGESDDAGIFNLNVPRSVKRLFFESKGFKSVVLPASVLEGPNENSKFRISIPMSTQDSLEVEPINQLSLSFNLPSSLNVDVVLTKVSDSNRHINLHFGGGKHLPNIILKDVTAGDYILTATLSNGNRLLNEEMTVGQGLTFKTVSILKVEMPVVSGSSNLRDDLTENSIRPPIVLYFEQSSYELKSEAKASLDTISSYLLNQPNLIANVTGYSDNIGERGLNVTLSEYRARNVAVYLTKKGVLSTQIVFKGQGPDSLAISAKTEASKIKSRRVIIQFSR